MYLISLYLDEDTNKTIQRYIDKVAEVTGNTFMVDNNVPPHMTICAIEARSIEVLEPKFRELEGGIASGGVQIVSMGQLLPYVMYIAPVMNEYLLDLSRIIYETYADVPETIISKYYKPLSWLPHITIGKTLNKEQMQQAFIAMQESFVPINARVTKIGLARVNPHEDVATIEL